MFLAPVITILFLKVIATFRGYREIRFPKVASFGFIFVPTEQFQPPLIKLHLRILLPTTIFSGLSGYDRVSDCLILLGWILQQLDFSCNLLGYDRKAKLPYNLCLCPSGPIIPHERWHIYNSYCLMYSLNACILECRC